MYALSKPLHTCAVIHWKNDAEHVNLFGARCLKALNLDSWLSAYDNVRISARASTEFPRSRKVICKTRVSVRFTHLSNAQRISQLNTTTDRTSRRKRALNYANLVVEWRVRGGGSSIRSRVQAMTIGIEYGEMQL